MSTKNIIAWVVVIAVVAFGAWYFIHDGNTPTDTSPSTLADKGSTGDTGAPQTPSNLPVIGTQASPGDITIDVPQTGNTVSSPLKVSGKAKGNWYFEASAPVIVIDTTGKILGRGNVTAQGDWMVATGTVPFSGNISFDGSNSGAGAIVFMNDNPSGQASTSKFLAVPVYFK